MLISITQLTTPSVFHSSTRMRWDRTVALILLVFSVTSIALAAPAVVRRTSIGVSKAASEKREGSDDEITDGLASEPMPEFVSESTDSSSVRRFLGLESLDDSSPSGSSHDDWPPASPAASFHEGTGAYQFLTYPVDFWRYDDESISDQDSAPESPDGSSHHDPALASLAGSSHQDSAPESPPSGSFRQDAIPDPQLSSPLHQDIMPDLQPSGSLHQDSVPGSPLHDTFFNDALKKNLKFYAGLGAIVGVPVGLTIGVQKLIKNIRSHRAYVSPLFPLLSTLT